MAAHAFVAQLVEQETENLRVVGSIPTGGTICGFSSFGRAPPCQGGGGGFETRNPLQYKPGGHPPTRFCIQVAPRREPRGAKLRYASRDADVRPPRTNAVMPGSRPRNSVGIRPPGFVSSGFPSRTPQIPVGFAKELRAETSGYCRAGRSDRVRDVIRSVCGHPPTRFCYLNMAP